MSYHMLATFAAAFRDTTERDEMERITRAAEARGEIAKPATWQGADLRALPPAEMERLLGDTVLKEFKVRLERIGLEYQTPPGP
jgi:hypothetical protein